jgi:hypothetical protein
MATRYSCCMALVGSFIKLVSAWWNVDRIRVPVSRQKDSRGTAVEQRIRDVDAARHRRASSKAKERVQKNFPISTTE